MALQLKPAWEPVILEMGQMLRGEDFGHDESGGSWAESDTERHQAVDQDSKCLPEDTGLLSTQTAKNAQGLAELCAVRIRSPGACQ